MFEKMPFNSRSSTANRPTYIINVRVRKMIGKGMMTFLLEHCCPVKYDTKEMSMVFQSKETIENNEKR